MQTILFKKIKEGAQAPTKAHMNPYSDAAWDLYACEDCIVPPGAVVPIDVGICIQLPRDSFDFIWEAQIRPRSSLRKKGFLVTLSTIDSGYRGELGCIAHNCNPFPYEIKKGDRICQIVINKLPTIQWRESDELNETERGSGCYGSTGK